MLAPAVHVYHGITCIRHGARLDPEGPQPVTVEWVTVEVVQTVSFDCINSIPRPPRCHKEVSYSDPARSNMRYEMFGARLMHADPF